MERQGEDRGRNSGARASSADPREVVDAADSEENAVPQSLAADNENVATEREGRRRIHAVGSYVTEESASAYTRIEILRAQLSQRDRVVRELTKRLRTLEQKAARDLVEEHEQLMEIDAKLRAVLSTRTFRYTAGVRNLYGRARQLGRWRARSQEAD